MKSIENEIVSFTAKVDLDEATAKRVNDAFNSIQQSADECRQRIEKANAALMKMRMEGKEDTAEFKAMEAALQSDVKSLKQLTKEGDAYAKQLGVQKMSMKQLREHAKQLKKEMDGMHDTKRLAAYQKELKATEDRISELDRNTQKTGGVLKGLGGKVAGGVAVGTVAVKALNAAVKLGRKVITDMATSTQKLGDAIRIEMAAANAIWGTFIRNLSKSREEIVLNYREVAKLAREAAALKDELFEMQNSYNITSAQQQIRMQEDEAVFRDSSKSIKERRAALEDMKQVELELARDRLTIAKQAEDAAYDEFRIETGLEREAAETFITEYLQAKKDGIVEEAQAYDQLIAKQQALQQVIESGAFLSTKTYTKMKNEIDRIGASIDGASENVVRFAATLRQYNLGEDVNTKGYAEAIAARINAEAAADPSAMEKRYARLNSQLVNGLAADAKAAREKQFGDRIKAAEAGYKEEMLILKEQLARREITESRYNLMSEAAEMRCIQHKIAVNKAYGKDVLDLENQLADKRIAAQKKIEAALDDEGFSDWMAEMAKAGDEAVDSMIADLTAAAVEEVGDALGEMDAHLDELLEKARSGAVGTTARVSLVTEGRDSELADLEEMHALMLVSEEEYQARRKEINRKAAEEISAIMLEQWTNAADMAVQFLEQVQGTIDALREAETAALEAQMEAQLTAAGDNADERERIEADFEAKKLEIQKKYADIDMGINIAKAIASGALAAVMAWTAAGGNPVLAGVYTALIAATTAAEVATIIAQRNAIKNTSASSSGSSAPTTTGTVGFSEGGYTGRGGRLEVAGVVHRGEYVVPQPQMRDPEVARMVASIESKRRRTSSKNALPGYAEGGYTGNPAAETDTMLSDIYDLLLHIASNPVPAYVVLSDLETKYDQQNRFRQTTSLKYRKK